MLENYSANEKKLVIVLACMTEIPKLRPDNKAPAWVQDVIEASATVRSDYLAQDAALTTMRSQLHLAAGVGHQAAISVYPIMQSIYRNDPVATESIAKLPVGDDTPALTLARLEFISKQWAELPNMPETNKKFVAGDLDKEAFDKVAGTLRSKIKELSTAEVLFKSATGDLNQQDAKNENFITAALKQGRGQFAEGTVERKLIESIATPTPAPATKSESESETPENAASSGTPGKVSPPATTTEAAPKAEGAVAAKVAPAPEASAGATPANIVNITEPPNAVNQ